MKTKLILLLLTSAGLCMAQTDASSGTKAYSQKKTSSGTNAKRSSAGDVPTTIADSVADTLKYTEGNFLGVAEAMPEEKYGYVPTSGKFDDARTFGEQVKHVACAQFAFFNEFEGKKPPDDCEKGGHDPAKTKAELIKYLKDSFDYSNRVIARLTARNALDRIEGRYAGPNTKLGISVVSVWHVTDHYGQLVEYLRMNGIVPPMTQKYGVKVR
ncbi:MAG TPA: DinB family protein [Candidatus Angelobacter sp.]|nr:DinB family protein [Candidatus Angelobacter sp.]